MKIRAIFILSLLLFAAGCKEDVETIESQQTSIVRFLTSTHNPRLIAKSEIAESLEEEPAFYTSLFNSAYRYIADYYNPDREQRQKVKMGDKVLLTFWCYDFSSYATPTASTLYYTNDASYEAPLQEAGLNTEYWDFRPKEVVLGSGDILNSIESSLVGCRVGDSVEIYLTYNQAYGDGYIGVTNLESPIAFFCVINAVEN